MKASHAAVAPQLTSRAVEIEEQVVDKSERTSLSSTQMLFKPKSRYLWDRAGEAKETRGLGFFHRISQYVCLSRCVWFGFLTNVQRYICAFEPAERCIGS